MTCSKNQISSTKSKIETIEKIIEKNKNNFCFKNISTNKSSSSLEPVFVK